VYDCSTAIYGEVRAEAMKSQTDDHERSLAFAQIALGQIKALRQPATPRNYEIWYSYATGFNPQ
jgi:diguanylate cyclase